MCIIIEFEWLENCKSQLNLLAFHQRKVFHIPTENSFHSETTPIQIEQTKTEKLWITLTFNDWRQILGTHILTVKWNGPRIFLQSVWLKRADIKSHFHWFDFNFTKLLLIIIWHPLIDKTEINYVKFAFAINWIINWNELMLSIFNESPSNSLLQMIAKMNEMTVYCKLLRYFYINEFISEMKMQNPAPDVIC